MVWATNADRLQLDGQTRHRLEYRGDCRLWMVLDRPFEITTDDSQPWSSLCFSFSMATFDQLFEESNKLEDMIDSAICLGFDLDLGMSAEEAQQNDQFISKAYRRKLRLFCGVDEIDACLGSMTHPDQVNLYMKRALFTTLPTVQDWRPDVEVSTLRQYLRKP